MGYPESEWERAMRRWREHFEHKGCHALFDRRRQMPSPRRAPAAEVERVLRLYRERYRGFNVRHFHEIARREHDVPLSYSWVKDALQLAGLVPKHRPRGRHRRRREPRACLGEMLHIDGSPHVWLALAPDVRATLIAVVDDATTRLLYAQLEDAESTHTVMRALHEVFTVQGLPMALYTDRASWAFHTPKAAGPVDKRRLTQVGRALAQLGVEHIPAYSPQARGRSERLNRTVQDRLVNELRVAGITTLVAANAYLRDVFIPHYNETFSRPPRDPEPAWVAIGKVDLDQILCHEETRVVGQDNTVAVDAVALQVAKQPGRRTCAGTTVIVRRHLNGHYAIWRGAQRWGHYDATGQPVDAVAPVERRTSRRPTRRCGPATEDARRPTAPTSVTLTKADKSLVKRNRTIHLSTTGNVPSATYLRNMSSPLAFAFAGAASTQGGKLRFMDAVSLPPEILITDVPVDPAGESCFGGGIWWRRSTWNPVRISTPTGGHSGASCRSRRPRRVRSTCCRGDSLFSQDYHLSSAPGWGRILSGFRG